MHASDIRTLFRYNRWANRQIMSAAQRVSNEAFTDAAPFPFGSLQGTLSHILAAERIWLSRCRDGVSPTDVARHDPAAGWIDLDRRWMEASAELSDYVEALTDDDLNATIAYRNTHGAPFSNLLRHILSHLVLHGMQHRAEAAAMLTGFGASPGDIDFIRYLREVETP